MNAFKKCALFTAGVVFMLVIAAALASMFFQGFALMPVAIALGVAGVIAVIAAAAVWLLGERYSTQAQRLHTYLDEMLTGNGKNIQPVLGFNLQQVPAKIESALESLRAQVKTLTNQKRELDVKVRICEAERQHLEAILNTITDGVVVTDAFNEIALANGSAARVLDFNLTESQKRPIDHVLHDPRLIKLIKDTREAGDACLRRNVEHQIGHNGDARTFQVTLSCVAPEAGKADGGKSAEGVAGVVTVLHDVTKDKEIAEMKSDFVSSVSHELRTPLSSIKAYMEMLVDGEANDEQTRADFYNIVQGETNRLSRLIDNILSISRIESGVTKVQRENIALPQIVREVVDIMLPQARAKDIELVEKPSPLYFQVFADRDMILQATLNLVGNAIKYTPNGGKVTIEIEVDEHAREVVLSVIDTGVGIPEEDVPRLFEKFFRVSNNNQMAKGTGLGLNLVKHVIETVHGGRVHVTSQVGTGSTFNFSLPIADK